MSELPHQQDSSSLRFVVLADVHMGTPVTQFPGQNYTYAADLLRRAVDQIRSLSPRHIFIVGDLVNMGTEDEYRQAADILREFDGSVSTVPGNHELVRGSIDDFKRLAIGATLSSISAREDRPVTIVHLNSGIEGMTPWHWHGRVDEPGLAALEQASKDHPDRPMRGVLPSSARRDGAGREASDDDAVEQRRGNVAAAGASFAGGDVSVATRMCPMRIAAGI